MRALVGYTGFVGSNLNMYGDFGAVYNSKNIQQAFGSCPDVLYYSGVPARKFISDKNPQQDLEIIENARENIRKIQPKKLVLISTVDVYKNPAGKTEDDKPDAVNAYGKNRAVLEELAARTVKDCHIVRLPGLYGKNIKKNFIYDYINYIPSLLTDAKIASLAGTDRSIYDYYADRGDGFWRQKADTDRSRLKKVLENVGFSALNFTDSCGVFQYYNLKYLYKDIQKVIDNDIKVMNIATQPVEIGRLYKMLTGKEFVNHITDNPPYYDFRTKHAEFFGRSDGYIQSREFVCRDIKEFVEEMK